MGKFTLDSFKNAVKTDTAFKNSIINRTDEGNMFSSDTGTDLFDLDNGVAIIHERNLIKYLEKYMCRDQDELSDYLYYNKGIFLKVI